MVNTVNEQQRADFLRDGVICLRDVIDADWIDVLRAGLRSHRSNPTDRARVWHRDEAGHEMFYDSQAWRQVEEYRDFLFHSPLAEIAGYLMGSSAVNLFFDAVFMRSAGTAFRTPFHQDEPYWSVDGFDTCSAWMPLVPVAKSSALELVRGSHLWPERYEKTNFGALTGDARDDVTNTVGTLPFPDIEGEREAYEIVSWDLEPGDLIMFNGRTIHGGSGKLPPDQGLDVFNAKWLGDDVRVCFRDTGMDPDHSDVMRQAGLGPGDRVAGELYPQVWTRRADQVSM